MSGFWWVLLIVVLILFPMSMLKPTARQKEQIRLREKARELGIRVDLVPHRVNDEIKLEGAGYRWLRPADAPALAGYFCLLKKEEGRDRGDLVFPDWQLASGKLNFLSLQQQASLADWLTLLPKDAFAVELGSATLVLWWREREVQLDLDTLNASALHFLNLNQ
ncbi:hypothetical protein [Marinospirillum insulare]|uniref:Preprotein translocase subunit YajC n=1 Tax=Marinospirillum insulare TaxID=217169 RepID=A0ABQ5ZXY4_9GAMM|nr:hypothetical protein [Marinospirillum insulare]GLR64292.1 hypothetical protein GCM10007878_17300 [Marinospirillum insulare]